MMKVWNYTKKVTSPAGQDEKLLNERTLLGMSRCREKLRSIG